MRKVMVSVFGAAGVASVAMAGQALCDGGATGLPGPVAVVAVGATEPAGASPTWACGGLLPAHEEALAFLAEVPSAAGPRALCFAPDSDPAVVAAFTAVLDGHNARANPVDRWTSTATNGGGLQQGEPITLTYSFVPDGTFVPNINGFQGNSNLRAFLNGIYGTQAVWQTHFDQVFARWSALTGINYVYEPNDDGATLNQNSGVLGVRGDIRIAGILLDGPSNILAYNAFPNDGDMVLDTGDSFFSIIGGNSIRLRNVVAHEHGHGMGLAHVCPITEQKLMEPFLTTDFNGPQHDDIRGAQRLYGDPFEPDNSPGQAFNIGQLSDGTVVEGTVPAPAISFGAIRSIDASGEQDWVEFSVPSSARVSVTLMPVGRSYDSSQQACGGAPGACCSGNIIDSQTMSDLSVAVVAGNGTTVLASANGGGAGTIENVSDLVLPNAGSYYIRVAGTGGGSDTQLYTLSITTELLGAIPLELSLPGGAPEAVAVGEATSFDVQIVEHEETLVPGSAVLMYRFDGGAFQASPLTPQGGSLWNATIPAASCNDQVEFFVAAEGSENGVQTVPLAGASAPFTAEVGTPALVAAFDFQTADGWTVQNAPSGVGTFDGAWVRGVPIDQGRGDPDSDYDGSGQCWVTDNALNGDVDGGETILTSPIFDVSGMRDVRVSYARWYSNMAGNAPQQDTMIVEISDNGGATWSTLEVVGPTLASPNGQVNGGWFHRSFVIDDLVALTPGLRVRFRVADDEPGSVVEAGVDAFEVAGRICEDPAPGCACEMDDTAGVDVFDLLAYLDLWFASDAGAEMDETAGIDVFDLLAFLDCWFPASAGEC